MSSPVRVVVADDHPMFRFGLVAALESSPDVDVVSDAEDGAALLAMLASTEVDVVLCDLEMPGTDGLAVIAELTSTRPTLPVVLLTMHEDERVVRAALEVGARGYLLKGADRDEIVHAVLTVADGGTVYGPGVGELVRGIALRHTSSPPLPHLTARERQVAELLGSGLGNNGIAHSLGLSEKTVRNHVSAILVKLAVPTRAAAVARIRDADMPPGRGLPGIFR